MYRPRSGVSDNPKRHALTISDTGDPTGMSIEDRVTRLEDALVSINGTLSEHTQLLRDIVTLLNLSEQLEEHIEHAIRERGQNGQTH